MTRITTRLLLILAAVAIIAAGILVLQRPNDVGDEPVRIGYLPIYVDLPLFVAQDRGFFELHGVDVELVRFSSSAQIGIALVTGSVDFGASIAYSVLLSTESRDPGQLKVFLVDSENPDNYLSSFVVLSDSGISSLADLRGKRIGSFPGPTAGTFGKMVLETAGLNPDTDVVWEDIEIAFHLSALEAGVVDALFTYEPTATQAVLEKNAVKLVPGAVESLIIDPWQAGVWAISTTFMETQPDQAQAVVRALYDALDYYRADPAAAKLALGPYTSIGPTVAEATPNIPFAKLGEVDLDAFQRHADILFDRGVISQSIDASALLAPATLAGLP